MDIATEDPEEFAASLGNELQVILALTREPNIQVFSIEDTSATVILTVELSGTTAIVQLASLLSEWLSRRHVQRISILRGERVLTFEEAPVDAGRIASLIFEDPA